MLGRIVRHRVHRAPRTHLVIAPPHTWGAGRRVHRKRVTHRRGGNLAAFAPLLPIATGLAGPLVAQLGQWLAHKIFKKRGTGVLRTGSTRMTGGVRRRRVIGGRRRVHKKKIIHIRI